ncbi:unnamed protein product [Vicia faba]|uniref:Transmembrane protein n=1 Tax=Vicia faba TaxID=3906 RepID=A0AAV0YQD6_VICFA|nr:unnamed protein product [Vicia faba]
MNSTCQLKYQIIETLTQGMKTTSNVIKFTQLIISISVFSFIFSPSSFFVFLQNFNFYFSTLPFQLYTHNIDKNSMFLLCNTLLVFVGLTKSFSSSSTDDDDDKPSNNSQYIEVEDEEGSQSHILDVEINEPMLEREVEKRTSEPDEQSAEEEEENIEKIITIDEEEEEDKEEMKEVEEEVKQYDGEDEEGDKGSEIDYVLIEENNIDYVEEEESCTLSTEDLNKKFEDFIRKMKDDLRIDARRHLVMV